MASFTDTTEVAKGFEIINALRLVSLPGQFRNFPELQYFLNWLRSELVVLWIERNGSRDRASNHTSFSPAKTDSGAVLLLQIKDGPSLLC